jgi:hypothetical protein
MCLEVKVVLQFVVMFHCDGLMCYFKSFLFFSCHNGLLCYRVSIGLSHYVVFFLCDVIGYEIH